MVEPDAVHSAEPPYLPVVLLKQNALPKYTILFVREERVMHCKDFA